MTKIELKNVSLEYSGNVKKRQLFPSFLTKSANTSSIIALKNFNLVLNEGDRVGLIGPNGAGKSTLLKILARVIKPTSGEIQIDGKVKCLFGPIPFLNEAFTPRQNITTFGDINNYRAKEIELLCDDVESFTELGEFFDRPLLTFSDGMKTRFRFALLTAIPGDILVIDEGIGAGDARFRKRAKDRLDKLYASSKIMVVASHSRAFIDSLCNQALLIRGGKMVCRGKIDEVFMQHQSKDL